MMKEIHEQPTAVRDTLSPRIKDGRIDLSELGLDEEAIKNVRRIYIIGCGSAYHVALRHAMCLKAWPACQWRWMWPAEFRYRDPVLEPDPWRSLSARAAKPPIPWLPCANVRSAACAPSAL